MKITAIIPTRGDVDVSPITRHLRTYPEIGHILVVCSDTPYSRYVWAARADTDLVYTQDDDCVTDIQLLIDSWKDEDVILNAMTPEHAVQYPGAQTLLGFGALFFRDLVAETFTDSWERDDLFYRESDRIFGTLNPHVTVFPKIEILPHATAPNRLYKQPEHLAARAAMNQRIFEFQSTPGVREKQQGPAYHIQGRA